jgi:hypothetical protein
MISSSTINTPGNIHDRCIWYTFKSSEAISNYIPLKIHQKWLTNTLWNWHKLQMNNMRSSFRKMWCIFLVLRYPLTPIPTWRVRCHGNHTYISLVFDQIFQHARNILCSCAQCCQLNGSHFTAVWTPTLRHWAIMTLLQVCIWWVHIGPWKSSTFIYR